MKNSVSYQSEQNRKNLKKINELLLSLPYFCSDFLLYLESTTLPLTRLNYCRDLISFFEYTSEYIFNKRVKEINFDDVNRIKAQDIERYLSFMSSYDKQGKVIVNHDKAKSRKLASVRSLFKYLFNRDAILSNVASKIKTPKIRAKDIVRLETDEVVRIIDEAISPSQFSARQQTYTQKTRTRDTAILSLFLGTGIRVSELVGINVKDVDFNANAFRITRKGGAETVLYFSDEVADTLKIWLIDRDNFLCDLKDDEKTDAFFISLQKGRLTVRAVENLVKKYAKIATPLKKISPHKLRSTYGTNLYRETKDIYVVADVLGHKDVNTTKKHYAAISEDIRREASLKVKLR